MGGPTAKHSARRAWGLHDSTCSLFPRRGGITPAGPFGARRVRSPAAPCAFVPTTPQPSHRADRSKRNHRRGSKQKRQQPTKKTKDNNRQQPARHYLRFSMHVFGGRLGRQGDGRKLLTSERITRAVVTASVRAR